MPTEEELPSVKILKDLGVDIDKFMGSWKAVLEDLPENYFKVPQLYQSSLDERENFWK